MTGPVRGSEALTFQRWDERAEDDEVGDNFASFPQLVSNHKSHGTHGVTGDDVWTVRLDTADESDVVVGHLLNGNEAIDGKGALFSEYKTAKPTADSAGPLPPSAGGVVGVVAELDRGAKSNLPTQCGKERGGAQEPRSARPGTPQQHLIFVGQEHESPQSWRDFSPDDT